MEHQEIRMRLAELDSDDWLDEQETLTIHEKALLDARLAAYAKDQDAGSTWEEVEGRIRARLVAAERMRLVAGRNVRACFGSSTKTSKEECHAPRQRQHHAPQSPSNC